VPLDFRNLNALWSSVLVETLVRAGIATAAICPGSRSGPLAIAFAEHPDIDAIPILDERSAAFFALGVGKRSARPAVLVCTSGTAAANFYPAAIEARLSHVPLLVLSGDRPPELRDCSAGQAIRQQQLFGPYPNWQAELSLPEASLGQLRYLRQTLVHAVRCCLDPVPGPVHLNVPLRDPLAPLPETLSPPLSDLLPDPEDFFAIVTPPQPAVAISEIPIATWQREPRGILIAGVAQPPDPERYCRAIAALSQALGWPVLAEGLSPVRNYAALNPFLVAGYDAILRDRRLAAELAPDQVVQLGPLPTSKELRAWLGELDPPRWILAPHADNCDPLHGNVIQLAIEIESLAGTLAPAVSSGYLKRWLQAEHQVQAAIRSTFHSLDEPRESKLAWILSQVLPPDTLLFVANSMPARDVEWFWQPGNRRVRILCNRGANGIDGTLSSALGMAHHQQPSVLLTGDLACLHDSNGWLLRDRFVGHLTVVLANNDGGGIFEMLPIAGFDPPFTDFFATPQQVDFATLCASYGVEHRAIASWRDLIQLLDPLPERGIRVLELACDRQRDARWRQEQLRHLARAAR